MRMIIEVSYDNLHYKPYFEFGKEALSQVIASGKSKSEFIHSTFNSCKVLKEDPSIKNYRMKVQTVEGQYFLYDGCPVENYFEANRLLNESELAAEIEKYKTLTPKEILVLEYNHQGVCKNKMKDELKIQKSTFKVHMKRIYKKLDIHNAKQFLRWCDRFLSSMKKDC